MKVLQVSQNLFVKGGSDRMFLDTCSLLERYEHEVIPFVAKHNRNPASNWDCYFPPAADFDRHRLRDWLGYLYNRHAAGSIRQLIREHKPDIAHLHIYYGKLTASILPVLKAEGVPVVHTMHEYRQISPNYSLTLNDRIDEDCCGVANAWRAVPRRFNRDSLARSALSVAEWYLSRMIGSLRHIDRLIAISDFQKRKAIEHGIPEEKITRVYNFVEPGTALHEKTGAGGYLLYFGRIEKIKGVLTLAQAAERLPDVRFKIVGEGRAESELHDFIKSRGLNNIELLGFKRGEELKCLIRDSLATVLPAQWYEPFGLTVLESFAQRRPVIASRIGALPELIDDGVDGLLFEPGNADELRDRITTLISNPKRADTMGDAGRAKLDRRFGPEIHYHELIRAYRQAGAK